MKKSVKTPNKKGHFYKNWIKHTKNEQKTGNQTSFYQQEFRRILKLEYSN